MNLDDRKQLLTTIQASCDDAVSYLQSARNLMDAAIANLDDVWGERQDSISGWTNSFKELKAGMNELEAQVDAHGQDLAYEALEYFIALEREEDDTEND